MKTTHPVWMPLKMKKKNPKTQNPKNSKVQDERRYKSTCADSPAEEESLDGLKLSDSSSNI